jgi:hypothetical protein
MSDGESSGSEVERSDSEAEGGSPAPPYEIRGSLSSVLRLLRDPFVEMLKSVTSEVNVDMVAMSVALTFVMSFMNDVKGGPLAASYADTSSRAFVELEERVIRDDSADHLGSVDRRVLDAGRKGRRDMCKVLMKYAREHGLSREAMLYFLYNELSIEIALPSMPMSKKIVMASLFLDDILGTPASLRSTVSFGRDGAFDCSELAACVSIGWLCNTNKSYPLSSTTDWFSSGDWSDAQSSISRMRSPSAAACSAWTSDVGAVVSVADGDAKAWRARVVRAQSQKLSGHLPRKRPSAEAAFGEGSSMRRVSRSFVSLEMSTSADDLLDRLMTGAGSVDDAMRAFERIGMDGPSVRAECERRMERFRSATAKNQSRPCVFSESERSAVRRASFAGPERVSSFSTGVRSIGPVALLPVSTWLAVATGGSDRLLSGALSVFKRDVQHAKLSELYVFSHIAPAVRS